MKDTWRHNNIIITGAHFPLQSRKCIRLHPIFCAGIWKTTHIQYGLVSTFDKAAHDLMHIAYALPALHGLVPSTNDNIFIISISPGDELIYLIFQFRLPARFGLQIFNPFNRDIAKDRVKILKSDSDAFGWSQGVHNQRQGHKRSFARLLVYYPARDNSKLATLRLPVYLPSLHAQIRSRHSTPQPYALCLTVASLHECYRPPEFNNHHRPVYSNGLFHSCQG